MIILVVELSYKEARGTIEHIEFDCQSTADLMPLTEIIGQERAIKALQFGLKIDTKGFNIYISGMPGTGKRSSMENYLNEIAKTRPVPCDWCYVNNFSDPNRPNALELPAGKGTIFKGDMEQFISEIRRALSLAFDSDEYANRRTETLRVIEEERNEVTKQVNSLAANAGFLLQRSDFPQPEGGSNPR